MKIGTILNLEYKLPGKEPEKYHCKIIDRTDNEFIIDYPVHTITKKTTFFSIGSSFTASYVGDENAIYQFPAKFKRKVILNIPGIAVSIPNKTEIIRIQRREFVRVDAAIDVAVHSKNRTFSPFTSVTSDISGGGLSIIVNEQSKFKLGEKLDIWLALPLIEGRIEYIHSTAQIIFIQSKNKLNTISVKFLSLKQQEQQKMISYCFEKQREVRKKELS